MAVVQILFHATPTPSAPPGFTRVDGHLAYRLLAVRDEEAGVTESGREVVLSWGDPVQRENHGILAAEAEEGRFRSLFGVSWIHYDRSARRLTVVAGRLGLFPVLLHEGEEATLLASDAWSMATIPGFRPRPGGEALLDLLAFGQVMGRRTTLQGVSHLPPGGVWSQTPGEPPQLHDPGPWTPERHPLGEREVQEILLVAVDRRFQRFPNCMIPLSGGVGSRLLLAAALAGGHKPATFTYGIQDDPVFRITGSLAESVFVPYQQAEVEGTPAHDDLARVARYGGGEVPLQQGLALFHPRLVESTAGSVLLTGTGAETFRSFCFTHSAPVQEVLGVGAMKGLLSPLVRRCVRQGFGHHLEPFVAAFPQLEKSFRQRIETLLPLYQEPAESAAGFMDAFYMGERVRRVEVAGQQLLRHYVRSHPYMDPEVISALAGLPVASRVGSRFQRQAVARLAPALAEVVWDRTGRPLGEGLRRDELVPGIALQKGEEGPLVPMPAFSPAPEWLESLDRGMLLETLGGAGLGPVAAERGLDILLAGPNRLQVLGLLGSFALWCQQLESLPQGGHAPDGGGAAAGVQGKRFLTTTAS